MIFFQFWNHQILDFAKLIFSHGCLYSHDAVHKMKLRKEEKTRAADHFLILTIISQPVSSSNLHNIFIQTQEFYPPPPDSLCALLLQYAATASSNLAST